MESWPGAGRRAVTGQLGQRVELFEVVLHRFVPQPRLDDRRTGLRQCLHGEGGLLGCRYGIKRVDCAHDDIEARVRDGASEVARRNAAQLVPPTQIGTLVATACGSTTRSENE